ncbi:MAG TPA: LytR C-terminal domain-containing protein [Rhizomicrobium sp.]|jgi:tetratricopeptide (TPR) repeat protein|nr:LytR C-terminal domain-containing protein [Rhizomicrobium sp.]
MRCERIARAALIAALMSGAAGCSLLPDFGSPVKVRPIPASANAGALASDEGDYQAAARAVENRDYALALDYLQKARDKSARDVRVFNALGVVYDKLGRFDLSARYYKQAEAIDPNSQVVRNNLAYSNVLRARVGGPAVAAELAPQQPDETQPASAAPTIVSIVPEPRPDAAPAQPPVVHLRPWGGVTVVDASGEGTKAEAMRRRLKRLGWVARASASAQPAQAQSVIAYAPSRAAAARALARSLRFSATLVACADGCKGIEFVLGADARIAAASEARAQSLRVAEVNGRGK